MHEMTITKNVVKVVVDYATKNNAKHIKSVSLEIGELRDIVIHLFEKCFQYMTKGTLAEGAAVNVEMLPLKCKCENCNEIFRVINERDYSKVKCPKCNSNSLKLYSGQEFMIRDIEIEC